jgi:predicted NAD/FAD-binding protein
MDVFRTWLPPGHPEPARVEHRRSFRHLIVDGQSRARQLEIARLQGQDGVFLAGMYTCDVDNHESVARSAMTLAERLSPESPQLALLRAALGGGLQRR